MATSLAAQKGYIIEVQGYSRGGVQSSQAMADSVVRYLVTAHQVPVYRIYRTGLGKQVPAASAATATASATGNGETEKPLTNGVRVTVLHNSLAPWMPPQRLAARRLRRACQTPHLRRTKAGPNESSLRASASTSAVRTRPLLTRENQGRLAPHAEGPFSLSRSQSCEGAARLFLAHSREMISPRRQRALHPSVRLRPRRRRLVMHFKKDAVHPSRHGRPRQHRE